MLETIHWLGHASFRIDAELCIYIDPWRLGANSPPADAILITHEHFDHFSITDIERIAKPHTTIITNQRVVDLLDDDYQTIALRPWQSVNLSSINIKALPAYTLDGNHPAPREDLGFVLAINSHDIYYAGDTDFVPDLRQIQCDIAILPVSAKEGLMTIAEVVDFVKTLKPLKVIPSHYGTSEGGTLLDAKALETALAGIADVVLSAET